MRSTWQQRQGVLGRGPTTKDLRRQARRSWFCFGFCVLGGVVLFVDHAAPLMLVMYPLLAGLFAAGAAYHAGQLRERERHVVVYPDADPGIAFEHTRG